MKIKIKDKDLIKYIKDIKQRHKIKTYDMTVERILQSIQGMVKEMDIHIKYKEKMEKEIEDLKSKIPENSFLSFFVPILIIGIVIVLL
jgi:hypothetical protein